MYSWYLVFALFFTLQAAANAQEDLSSNADINAQTPGLSSTDATEGSGSEKIVASGQKPWRCKYIGPAMSVLNGRQEELACCNKTIDDFRWEWFRGGFYLQTFFEKLKVWRCPQFQSVCAEKEYSKFSEYSKMVYLYHCNETIFQEECTEVIFSLRGSAGGTSWDNLTRELAPSEFSTESLTEPCIQVTLYSSDSGGYGFYHETIDTFAPFCDISWCGFDAKTIQDRKISSWTCMSSSCRTNLIISSVVCALLALAIVLANVTVIAVFTTSPKLRNSQAVYKISLAIADLLVGLFVIPTFISSLMLLYKSPATMGDIMTNAFVNAEGTIQRKSSGRFRQRFSIEYIDFVGFFTILSLVVSIYTLMMASCDRFMAIYQPLRYGRHNAKRIAVWASLVLWVIAIFFSAMSYFVPEMKYGLVASVMVASNGESALYLYAIAVVLPLLFVWISTLATYLSTKRHAKKRLALTIRRSNSGGGNSRVSSMETRLARTLASMVGVFTLCLLPTTIVLIVPFFLDNLYHHLPHLFNPAGSKAFISAEFVAILLLMTNSLWNCFIYNARNEEFKLTAKRLYRRLLRKLGIGCLFKGSKDWATATVRSNRTGYSTSGASSLKVLQKKPSKQTLRTMPSNHSNVSASRSLTSNNNDFLNFLPSENGHLQTQERDGVMNPVFEQNEQESSGRQMEQENLNKAETEHKDQSHATDAV